MVAALKTGERNEVTDEGFRGWRDGGQARDEKQSHRVAGKSVQQLVEAIVPLTTIYSMLYNNHSLGQ